MLIAGERWVAADGTTTPLVVYRGLRMYMPLPLRDGTLLELQVRGRSTVLSRRYARAAPSGPWTAQPRLRGLPWDTSAGGAIAVWTTTRPNPVGHGTINLAVIAGRVTATGSVTRPHVLARLRAGDREGVVARSASINGSGDAAVLVVHE